MSRAFHIRARRWLRTILRRWRGAPSTWLIVGGIVLMLVTAAGTALTIYRSRQNTIENGRQGLESAVVLLARHFDRQFDDFSVLQRSIAAELESHGIESPDLFRSVMGTLAVHEALRQRATGWSDVAGANVFDADGVLINSSQRWPVAEVSIADRGYFQRLKHAPSLVEEVEVVTGRFGGGKAIVFGRRISGPHGEFLGIVSRAITPNQIEAFFASSGLGEDASISIHHRNGQLLARYPHVEGLIGQNLRQGPPQQIAVFEHPALTTRLASPVDGKDRLLASRMLTDKPLVIVATKTLDSVLATWRSQTKFFLTVAALSIGLLVVTLYLLFRQMTRQLSIEKTRLDTAVNNMANGLLLFDQDERLIVCNRRYIEMYGLSPDVVKPGCGFRELIQHRRDTGSFAGDVDSYCDAVIRSISRGQSSVIQTTDGRLIEIRNEPVPSGGWLATHEDVTERVRAEERIARLAHYDPLTELPNRILMRAHLERRIGELGEGKQFAVFYVDVDEFKTVNDSLGHSVGDAMLRHVAERLRGCVGPQDLVARLGGDEFAIIRTVSDEPGELTGFAERVLQSIRTPLSIADQEIRAEASIGIAIAPEHGDNSDDLLKRADLAMYAAKADGRRTFRLFMPELDLKLRQRRELERDLRQAIERGDLQLHYQPLVDLTSGSITACEALLRWQHPEKGMIPPAEFIPLAEETGLINPIGDWVLRQACREAATWRGRIKLAINVSAAQFRSGTLALKVASALTETGLPPDRLEVEITETVLISDDEDALRTLNQLRELGVRIALDDFGTGYSSLSYLRRFPFDKIKIDRSFVGDIAEPSDSSAIVEAVVQLAAARRMDTTAEGVETEMQRDTLRRLGCTEMQGYLFSPPLPAARLRELLASHEAAAA